MPAAFCWWKHREIFVSPWWIYNVTSNEPVSLPQGIFLFNQIHNIFVKTSRIYYPFNPNPEALWKTMSCLFIYSNTVWTFFPHACMSVLLCVRVSDGTRRDWALSGWNEGCCQLPYIWTLVRGGGMICKTAEPAVLIFVICVHVGVKLWRPGLEFSLWKNDR